MNFRTINNGLDRLYALNSAAYQDWKRDNLRDCLARLEEMAADCDTLASQIRDAVADALAQAIE